MGVLALAGHVYSFRIIADSLMLLHGNGNRKGAIVDGIGYQVVSTGDA